MERLEIKDETREENRKKILALGWTDKQRYEAISMNLRASFFTLEAAKRYGVFEDVAKVVRLQEKLRDLMHDYEIKPEG